MFSLKCIWANQNDYNRRICNLSSTSLLMYCTKIESYSPLSTDLSIGLVQRYWKYSSYIFEPLDDKLIKILCLYKNPPISQNHSTSKLPACYGKSTLRLFACRCHLTTHHVPMRLLVVFAFQFQNQSSSSFFGWVRL